jgi:4-hydroxybenzoate polyprenyltransferase
MLKLIDFLYFYRILRWKDKTTSTRIVLHSILGYLLAGKFVLSPIFLNTLAVFAGAIFCYSFHDYFDWKLNKNGNFLSAKMKEGKLTEKKALIYCLFPLMFFLISLIFLKNLQSVLLLLCFLLVILYFLPPFRFREGKILRFIVPPLAELIIFWEGYLIFGHLETAIILFSILMFIFLVFIEIMHNIEHTLSGEEKNKINQNTLLKLFKNHPIISLIISLFFSFYNRIFLITSFFSLVRLMALREFKIEDVKMVRKNLILPQWSLYEFLIYGIIGIINKINF